MDDTWSREFGELDASDELRESIKPELEPGERLLWASKPGPRVLKKGSGNLSAGVAVWAVGMVILGVVCWYGSKLTSDRFAGLSALLLTVAVISGVISFLIVLGWLSSTFTEPSDRASLADQVYALTDQRAIFKITDPRTLSTKVQSFHRGMIKGEDLHRVQYPDGSGDVVFLKGYGHANGFLDVAEVRRVEGLIRRFLIAPATDSTS